MIGWILTTGLALAWALCWRSFGDTESALAMGALVAIAGCALAAAAILGFKSGVIPVLTGALWVAVVVGFVNVAVGGDNRGSGLPECASVTNGGLGGQCRASLLEQAASGLWYGAAIVLVGASAAGIGAERRRPNRLPEVPT